jgi:hypothetical protein
VAILGWCRGYCVVIQNERAISEDRELSGDHFGSRLSNLMDI